MAVKRPPLGTPLTEKSIEEALVTVPVHVWFELGRLLGIEEHVLKKIDQDNSGETEWCKRADMLNEWLKNGLDHTWEHVETAVEEVIRRSEEKRKREEEKTRQEVEGRKTLQAISQIETAMEKMNSLVDQCAKEKIEVARKLEEEDSQWDEFERGWKLQEEQWKEQEETIQQIKNAIADDDLESEFVERYLREKSAPTHINKEGVESWLRKEILNEEAEHVKALLTHHKDTKNHQVVVTHIKQDSEKWIEQLENHRKRLEHVLSKLHEIGLNDERLGELHGHLEELGSTLSGCELALKECDKVEKKIEGHLKKSYQEVLEYSESFNQSLQELEQCLVGLKPRVDRVIAGATKSPKVPVKGAAAARTTNVAGAAAGAATGTTMGAIIGGVLGVAGGPAGMSLGAALGSFISGAIFGGITGRYIGRTVGSANAVTVTVAGNDTGNKLPEPIETEQTDYEKLWDQCQSTQANVKKLLQTLSKLG